ncbi:MAG: hypothetical protein ABIJ65_12115 [Chloroflexota bacterium]
MDNFNLQAGIETLKAGDKAGAQLIFIEVLKQDLDNEEAWLLLESCLDEHEDKIYCFQKVLAINPNNITAQTGLAEEKRRKDRDSNPNLKLYSGTVFQCSTCGSLIGEPEFKRGEKPSALDTTPARPSPIEKKTEENYLDNCKAALDVRNYYQALQYANDLLEIEPENFEAWIYKATATFWLSTEENNRFNEAMQYLEHAEKIDRQNTLVESTRIRLREGQCEWYTYLGDQTNELIEKIMDENESNPNKKAGISEVNAKCQEPILKAMNYYLLASKFDPNNLTPLYKMKYLAEFGDWLFWSSEIREKISYVDGIDQENKTFHRLTNLKMQLKESQTSLTTSKKGKGLFSRIKMLGLKRHISSLNQQIGQEEKTLNSQK